MSCRSYSCRYDCCDINGYCPSSSSNCYYYYSTGMTTGAIVGIIIGILFFFGFVFLMVYLCRRCRERQMAREPPPPPVTAIEIYPTQPTFIGPSNQVPPYGQPYPNTYNQPYPNNYNQPYPNYYNQSEPNFYGQAGAYGGPTPNMAPAAS